MKEIDKEGFGAILAQALNGTLTQQPTPLPGNCDCSACTGVFTAADKLAMKPRMQQALAREKGIIATHMHGNDGKYLPFTVTVCSSVQVPDAINLLVPVIDPRLAQMMMDRICALLVDKKIDKSQLHQGFEISADDIEFSHPVRLYEVEFSKLIPEMQNTISAMYEVADRPVESTWQIVLTDSSGKFPTDFGYNHQQMIWQSIYGNF